MHGFDHRILIVPYGGHYEGLAPFIRDFGAVDRNRASRYRLTSRLAVIGRREEILVAHDEESPSFRTKTGTCTITDDEVVLSREGVRGAAARTLVGSSVNRLLIVYLGLAAGFAFIGVRSILEEQIVVGALLCLFSLYLVQGVVRSRGLSAAPEIPRSSIQRVDAHRPRPPLTRGYFVVHFRENGEPRKRLIMLPGSLSGGRAEFEKAIRVLETAGLMKPSAE